LTIVAYIYSAYLNALFIVEFICHFLCHLFNACELGFKNPIQQSFWEHSVNLLEVFSSLVTVQKVRDQGHWPSKPPENDVYC